MKPRSAAHIFAYLALALIAYGIGLLIGSGVGFAAFFIGGALLELLFWVELVRRLRGSNTP